MTKNNDIFWIDKTSVAKYWYKNDNLHRVDGPAVECANGTKSWYISGKRHREDGPAIERADGSNEWHLNGRKLTEKEFLIKIIPVMQLQEQLPALKAGLLVEIEGEKYKLQKDKIMVIEVGGKKYKLQKV
ncbi:MAG: hypothetical protein Q8O87_04185 [bacterium]|nr:hypothetical protein [bacterium]